MKVVGQCLTFTLILLGALESFAGVKCRGNFYTRLETSEVSESRIEFVSQYYNSNPYIPSPEVSSPFIFRDNKKYDDWEYVRIYRDRDFVYSAGFRDSPYNLNFREMNLDKETFLKFKDQARVGFNLICKMR